jgi:hypothetical protein
VLARRSTDHGRHGAQAEARDSRGKPLRRAI